MIKPSILTTESDKKKMGGKMDKYRVGVMIKRRASGREIDNGGDMAKVYSAESNLLIMERGETS